MAPQRGDLESVIALKQQFGLGTHDAYCLYMTRSHGRQLPMIVFDDDDDTGEQIEDKDEFSDTTLDVSVTVIFSREPLKYQIMDQVPFNRIYRRELEDCNLNQASAQQMMLIAYASDRECRNLDDVYRNLEDDIAIATQKVQMRKEHKQKLGPVLFERMERLNLSEGVLSRGNIADAEDTLESFRYIQTKVPKHEGWLRNYLSR